MVALGHQLRGQRLDLRPLVALGHHLQREDEADLITFRDGIALHPDRLRHQWLGKTALGRQKLSPARRAMLDVLGLSLDLFEPSRSRFDERMHTETMAWFLNLRGTVGDHLRDAFLRIVVAGEPEHGQEPPTLEELCPGPWRAVPERTVPPYGRVDVWLESTPPGSTGWVVAVEAKVGAGERDGQVRDYHLAQGTYAAGRRWLVVFLTVAPGQQASGPCLHVTFRGLLRAWLPVAVGGTSSTYDHLRLYLATLARLCGIGQPGEFDDWGFAARGHALDLVERA
jgi:hypothetical protein